ncbi:LETM1 domain-containing protein 1 isoform X2 [Lycorma delicatula]
MHWGKKQNEPREQYFLSRYMAFIERYSVILDKRFPKATQLYRVFMLGTKDFYADLKNYIVVVRKKNLSTMGLHSLKRSELQLYYKMPKDIVKVTPVLIVSLLPMFTYVIFPLLYFFPRQLLSSHFWSLQQRAEFAIHFQRRRLHWYKPVFRSLQAQLDSLQSHPCYDDWQYVIRLIGSGLHPNAETIIKCKPLFVDSPYHLRKLYTGHVRGLLKLHDMHLGWRRRTRLEQRAKLIQLMDRAIVKEGGIATLSNDEIRWACSFRGLSPTNMTTEEMVMWLTAWISVSNVVDKDSWSLLLHCPILLAYNHPSNWVLIH